MREGGEGKEDRTELPAPLGEFSLLVFHRELVDIAEEGHSRGPGRVMILDALAIPDVRACDDEHEDEDGGRHRGNERKVRPESHDHAGREGGLRIVGGLAKTGL